MVRPLATNRSGPHPPYSPPTFSLVLTDEIVAFQWSGYTQQVILGSHYIGCVLIAWLQICDRSARVEGFYLVFVFTVAQGFLSTRCIH